MIGESWHIEVKDGPGRVIVVTAVREKQNTKQGKQTEVVMFVG